MEFRQLRYAVRLAQTLSFRRSAELEHITQSTFSEHIARLENEVGARLFERGPRGVRLTSAGAVFVERADVALASMAATIGDVRDIHSGAVGALTVGVFAEGLAELTPEIVSAFRAASPQVSLRFIELTISTQQSALADGSVDVALIRPPFGQSEVRIRELFDEPRLAAVGVRHPFADADVLTIDGLLDEPVVATVPGPWGTFWSCDDVRGSAGRPAATVSSVSESLASVAYLGAVDTVPSSSARYYRHPGVRYTPLVDAPMASAAIAHRRDDRSLVTEAFCRTAAHVTARHIDLVPGAILSGSLAVHS